MGGVRLGSLLDALVVKGFTGVEDQPIEDISYDSRQVRPGGLFVAVRGLKTDGHLYIDDAIRRGAVAVVAEQRPTVPSGVSVLTVDNTRRGLAALAAAFYRNPSEELFLIGITGTNGKTTTSYLIEAVLGAAGYSVGVIGTINYRFNGRTFRNPVTTPESLDLMRILRQMADAGVSHVVLEVSSHALDLDRVAFCEFDIGVFTNLSQDHLDYHKDMESYWACKKKLCLQCLESGSKRMRATAVVNRDDPRGEELASEVSVRCCEVGLSDKCAVRADDIQATVEGVTGRIQTPSGFFDFRSALVGRHNVYNILAAAGVAVAMGIDSAVIKRGIEALQGVPGRLESVQSSGGFAVFVDYAHTPDALENVLKALKGLTVGRLITIFGCGGDRDRKKRPMMGHVAARLSDLSILTSDNPRSESPNAILLEIEQGVVSAQARRYPPEHLSGGFDSPAYAIEPDRRGAIALGLNTAREGDTVLIAGKGHETYQIVGARTIAFDDRVEAKSILERLMPGSRSDR